MTDVDIKLLKDSGNRYRTMSLFVEYANPKYITLFTLEREDKDGAISLYQKYMEIADPTEYQVAMQLLGDWRHWEVLTNCSWFKPIIEDWRRELEARRKSVMVNQMENLAATSKQEAVRAQAIRWLEANTTDKPKKTRRGRPSKEEVEGRLKQELKSLEEFDDDAKRLGIQ
jgi:hypothetical protein